MRRITLFLFVLTISLGYSQNLPIDFESATTWGDFNGGIFTTIANPQNNADNNSANVGQMVKNAGETWGGSSLVLSSTMDFDTNNTFTMKAYTIKSGTKVLLKVENSADSGIFYEQEVTMSTTNTWETLTFDFSGAISANNYDKVVIIFDNGTSGDGSANFTFYIDDIILSNVIAGPSCMDGFQNGDETGIDCGGSCPNSCPSVGGNLPLDFESSTTWVDFNGGEVTTIINPQNNVDNNSANVGQMVKNAGEVWGGSSLVLGSALDFANNNTISMKAYSIKAGTKVLFKVENSADSNIFYEREVTMNSINTWETLTFDFSGADPVITFDKVVVIFDNGTAGDGSANFTFLMDDITLYNQTAPECFSGSTGALPGTDYVLVWADEFDIDGPPCDKNWGYDIGAGGWGNGESQYYTNSTENASVSNGVLTIKAKKENFNGSQYTSARLLTKDKYEFTYGRVDIRAKLPVENGTWSALWMLGANFPDTPWPAAGEIDIMEHTGNNENITLGTVHNTSGSGGAGAGSNIAMPTPTEFHNYSIEWSEEKIEFFVDEVLFFTYNPTPKTNDNYPYNSDFFLIMNIAMGGTLGGSIDPLFSEATMEIDYVRVYQKAFVSNNPIVSAPEPTIPEANVLSVFSDTYTTNTVSNLFFSAFNGSGTYTLEDIESDGNTSIKMDNLSYYGDQWDAVNINVYTHVHFDYWTHDSKALNFYLIDQSAGIPGGDIAEARYSILETGGDQSIVYDSWIGVDIPLQHFLDYDSGIYNYDLNDIFQYKFDGNGTVYFDNVYFTNDSSLGIRDLDITNFKVFPNPTQDIWIVKSESENIKTIELFSLLGKSVLTISTNSKEVKIDASQLTSGLYLTKVITENGVGSMKLIKQ